MKSFSPPRDAKNGAYLHLNDSKSSILCIPPHEEAGRIKDDGFNPRPLPMMMDVNVYIIDIDTLPYTTPLKQWLVAIYPQHKELKGEATITST